MVKKVNNKKIHNTQPAPNEHYKGYVVNQHNGRQFRIPLSKNTRGR